MCPGVRIASASIRSHRSGSVKLGTYQHAGPSRLPAQAGPTCLRFAHTRSETAFSFPTHTNPTPYDIFHFTSRRVSQPEIKARYYDLVRALHPDRFIAASTEDTEPDPKAKGKGKEGSNSKNQAHEQFKLVVDAYNLLKDPYKKQVYDRSGIGWDRNGLASDRGFGGSASSRSWQGWQDNRYRRPSSHDRHGWQTYDFYSNQYSGPGGFQGNAGWNGGNGQFASNGRFISSLFLLTWVLAGVQYFRLSQQSQHTVDRMDKNHLNAAQSLQSAREQARSDQGRARLQAFRRRAREQRTLEELDHLHTHAQFDGTHTHAETLLLPPPPNESRYGIGHGGPSGKQAAQERLRPARNHE